MHFEDSRERPEQPDTAPPGVLATSSVPPLQSLAASTVHESSTVVREFESGVSTLTFDGGAAAIFVAMAMLAAEIGESSDVSEHLR